MSAQRVVDELSEEKAELQLTPMIDISFLIIIFFMCLPFKTLEGKLQAFLPTDKGINPIPQDPLNEIKVSVHIVARKEVTKQFGPGTDPARPKDEAAVIQNVAMPTQVKYRFGDRETDELKTVYSWIMEGKQAAEGSENQKVLGEIKAAHKIPHKFVIAVLNKFSAAGLEKVDFFGTQIPKPEMRRKQFLPYPTSNYVGVR